MSANNRISKVVIVGAGGNSGRYMAEALVATGNHTVTALTRPNSTSPIPAGVRSIAVDYTDKESLTVALRGQDALIITLAVTSPPDTHSTLVEAAAAAGVPWILPNDWTPDTSGTVDTGLITDIASFSIAPTQRAHIVSFGVSSYISVITGFWYEWSLAIPAAFGFDFASRTATFFDDGKTQLSLSTWRQVGRAVALLLSLPIEREEGSSASLADFRNKVIYVASFTTSQAEIFESILRVTGDKREDWKIKYETSRERFEGGVAVLKQGKEEGSNTHRDKQTHPTGDETSREQFERGVEAMKQATNQAFVHMLYARVLFPVPGVANTEKMHGLVNDALGLQKEDLDEATRLGIERAQATKT